MKNGFTLIELLVVIAIIGILSTVGIASFTSAQARGRDATRKSDLAQMKRALEMVKNDSLNASYYPEGIYVDRTSYSEVECGQPWPADGSYMKTLPCDPKTGLKYSYHALPAECLSPGTCTTYLLFADLENTADPVTATSASKCGIASPPAGRDYVCPD